MKIGYLAIALVLSTGIVNNTKNKSLNNIDKVSDFDKGYEYYKQKRYAQAFKWYQKAAEQGLAMAQNNLGYMYRDGRGTEQDLEKAFKWFQKAAEQGLLADK